MARIWETFGDDARSMTLRLLEAAEAWRLVPAGGTVALKPNLVLPSRPEEGAVTHPGVVEGCIEYFRAHGASDISVIESSWVGAKTMPSLRASGIARVLERHGVPFFDLKRDEVVTLSSKIGPIDVCARAYAADLLVDLPVLKGHCQTRMTCALKNLKGCIPDSEKRRFHRLGLTRPIAALAAVLTPGLTVVDAICGDLSFEEGGTPVRSERMFCSTDPVAADAWGLQLMGLSSEDVPYVGLAEEWGAGSACVAEADVVRLSEPTVACAPVAPTGHVAHLTRHVREDSACSACYAALVRALYATGGRYQGTIAIGQGFQGKHIPGLGIGRCCAGADECVMGCPPTSEAIARRLREG